MQVSRLDISKNHLQLINIYAKLKKLGIKEKLLIIGDGETYQQLKQRIAQLGLEQDCLLLGSKSNPYPFMKNAKLFLHTSLSEGLPTVLIESMVCGVPVVAMDCQTGPKEILNNGKYGELVKLKDEEEFVQKTYKLLKNKDLLQNFKEKTQIATNRFSFDYVDKSINALFIQIFSNNLPLYTELTYCPYKPSLIRKLILRVNRYLVR
ncbi:hypothetical protein B0186_09655 [Canicola haemoglobinophilus]|uniref:Glycosyl transferase family protein n=1 Tax=Canicola haemoglobinophilus TaxID=733 RepID=A0A1V4AZ46_9PAST|nr:glycosyltransferase [Canicola haemoglobinophilus]OOR98203.1 hypothetical protein B0186_09655 [Canicola haemoglobinophilus]STO58964.1 glycosyl transferase family protein [Canicola haemoglobinophilus]